MKSIREIREAAGKSVRVNWDMGNPDQYAGDWQDQGINLDNVGKSDITVSGTVKDLLTWLVNDYGMSANQAKQAIKTGKRITV